VVHVPFTVREREMAAAETIGQRFVVDAQLIENGGDLSRLTSMPA